MIHHLVAALILDGGHGNGRHNRNVVSAASPTHNRGYQHTNNGNSGGNNPAQNALCGHVTVCNVTQKVIVVVPVPPAPAHSRAPVQSVIREPAQEPAQTVVQEPPPAPVPVRPAVQALPQPAVPRCAPAPARRVRPSGPYFYLGSDGSVRMGTGETSFGIG